MLLTRAAITAARSRANNLSLGVTPQAVVARRTREGKRRSSLVDKRELPRLDSDNLARSTVERLWGTHASLKRVPTKPPPGKATFGGHTPATEAAGDGGRDNMEATPGAPKDSLASIDATPVPDTSFEASSDEETGGGAKTPVARLRVAGLAALSARSMASMVLSHSGSGHTHGKSSGRLAGSGGHTPPSWRAGAGRGAGAGAGALTSAQSPAANRTRRPRSSSTPTGRVARSSSKRRARTPHRKKSKRKQGGRDGTAEGADQSADRNRRMSWRPRLPEFAGLNTTLEDIQWLAEVRTTSRCPDLHAGGAVWCRVVPLTLTGLVQHHRIWRRVAQEANKGCGNCRLLQVRCVVCQW